MSVNGARGEVATVIGGRSCKLCLTLGALAEMETGLGVSGIDALTARLGDLSARDILVVLAALLRGGGESVSADDLAREPLTLRDAAAAIIQTFAAANP